MRLKTPSRHHVWEILISKAQPIVNKEGFSQISRNSLLTAPSYLPILAICLNLLDLLKTFAFKKLIKYVAPLCRGSWAGKLVEGGSRGIFLLSFRLAVNILTKYRVSLSSTLDTEPSPSQRLDWKTVVQKIGSGLQKSLSERWVEISPAWAAVFNPL